MTRTIDLRDDALLVRYSGFSALLRLTGELRIPYDTIRSVSVGYAGSPGAFTPRIGLNAWPFGARRGMFWIGAERLFLDFGDPSRAVVLELEGAGYNRVAIEPDTPPDELAERLRSASGAS